MVECMKQFLAEFQQAPYSVEKVEGCSQYRITNTFSEFYAIVRPYRGQVLMRIPELDDDAPNPYRWVVKTPASLKRELGLCAPRDETKATP